MKQHEKVFKAVSTRKKAYGFAFPKASTHTAIVLGDLAKFCRANTPCIGADNDETNRLLGRNEVWHRIVQHLKLSDVDLFSLYAKLTTEQRQALFDPQHTVTYNEDE